MGNTISKAVPIGLIIVITMFGIYKLRFSSKVNDYNPMKQVQAVVTNGPTESEIIGATESKWFTIPSCNKDAQMEIFNAAKICYNDVDYIKVNGSQIHYKTVQGQNYKTLILDAKQKSNYGNTSSFSLELNSDGQRQMIVGTCVLYGDGKVYQSVCIGPEDPDTTWHMKYGMYRNYKLYNNGGGYLFWMHNKQFINEIGDFPSIKRLGIVFNRENGDVHFMWSYNGDKQFRKTVNYFVQSTNDKKLNLPSFDVWKTLHGDDRAAYDSHINKEKKRPDLTLPSAPFSRENTKFFIRFLKPGDTKVTVRSMYN